MIVEIGTCRGGSAVLLGLSNPENSDRVYSIDIVQEPRAKGLVEQFGLKCNLIEAHSSVYGRSWNKGLIDLLFIDGNHMEENVYNDMCAWAPFIRTGGYMLMHDSLRKKSRRTYMRRNRIDENGRIISHVDNTNVNVYNATKRFTRENSLDFKESERINTLHAIQKI